MYEYLVSKEIDVSENVSCLSKIHFLFLELSHLAAHIETMLKGSHTPLQLGGAL